MKKTVLTVGLVLAVSLLTACSGTDVRALSDEASYWEQELTKVDLLIDEMEEVATHPDAPAGWAEDAEQYLPVLRTKRADIEAAFQAVQTRLDQAVLTDEPSVSNGLEGGAAVLTGVAPLLGPYAPFAALGAATLTAVGGFLRGRRKGVDETLDAIETSDLPVSPARDPAHQAELSRAGSKAVASGIGRKAAAQWR